MTAALLRRSSVMGKQLLGIELIRVFSVPAESTVPAPFAQPKYHIRWERRRECDGNPGLLQHGGQQYESGCFDSAEAVLAVGYRKGKPVP